MAAVPASTPAVSPAAAPAPSGSGSCLPQGDDPQQWRFPYVRHADQDAAAPVRRPVVVIGAGPVGLALAIDLAQREVPVVLLDDGDSLAHGSRAICFAQRTLEIFDRLGCGQPMVDKGVSWHRGRVFFRDEPVYHFDLQADSGRRRPAFINLQQYYVEGFLARRAAQLPAVDLRWRHAVTAIAPADDGVTLTVTTPDGAYPLVADYVVACDGSRSPTRRAMGLSADGRTFQDRFLIVDIRLDRPHPAERWFWFDPPFHPGQSVLLHVQPDGVWRIDFQLGWDADPVLEKTPERIVPRVTAMLAHAGLGQVSFEIEWASVYTFSCQRMARFRHGRVLFAGDAAHCVSPFGARGANGGVQDADNLGWKLARVLRGQSPDSLLDTYGDEREPAADENLRHSTRSTDFITPKSAISRAFRDAVLHLSRDWPFARALVNSGRLSVPHVLVDTPLHAAQAPGAADDPSMPGCPIGSAAPDAPLGDGRWLLASTDAVSFTLVTLARETLPFPVVDRTPEGHAIVDVGGERVRWLAVQSRAADRSVADGSLADRPLADEAGLLADRLGLSVGGAVLLRPDQHLCGRWRADEVGDGATVADACRRATGQGAEAGGAAPAATPATASPTGGSSAIGAVPGLAPLPSADRSPSPALIVAPHLDAPDDFYEALIAAHQGLDDGQSQALNARLVLLLANHVGRRDVLDQALAAARAPA